MTLCSNGLHEIDPASTWRASRARCRECNVARNRRYNVSAKGRIRSARWDRTSRGLRRRLNAAIRAGQEDTRALEDALAEREEYEASGSTLSFYDWLNKTYPLPKLKLL